MDTITKVNYNFYILLKKHWLYHFLRYPILFIKNKGKEIV